MRVLVTGASGFVGKRFLQTLLEEPAISIEGERFEKIDEIIVTTRSAPNLRGFTDQRLVYEIGDLRDQAFLSRLFEKRIDSIFHMASSTPLEIDEKFDASFADNFQMLYSLLEICRFQNNRPRFVFPGSTAAFGGPLPERVADNYAQTPQTSFGAAKCAGELLIDTYTRNGFIDGRTLRLPFIIVRPDAKPGSISDRIGAILREPLLGRNVICPFKPETCVPLTSVRNAAQSLLRLHQIPSDRFGHTRAMNMPALTVLMSEIADAIQDFDYPASGTRGRVIWEVEEGLQGIVDGWPSATIADEALRHGLKADSSINEILAQYVEDYDAALNPARPMLAVI